MCWIIYQFDYVEFIIYSKSEMKHKIFNILHTDVADPDLYLYFSARNADFQTR